MLGWPQIYASCDHIPVYKGVVDSEGQDEIDQLLLDLSVALLALVDLALLLAPEVQRVCRLAIHGARVYVNVLCGCVTTVDNSVYAGMSSRMALVARRNARERARVA